MAIANPCLLHAEKPSNQVALDGLTSGKVVWDINMAEPMEFSLYLKVIQKTYDDIISQGVTPDMIFAFRGKSVLLISTIREGISDEQKAHLDEVAKLLKDLIKRPGVRMEACSLAYEMLGIKAEYLLNGVQPVGNTFVSLIGYQAKGYGTISIY
jgi:peroxiredoxin family protein